MIKRIFTSTLIAVSISLATIVPTNAATTYRELADCASANATPNLATCYAGVTLVSVSALNRNERVFNGKLSPVKDNVYSLTNGVRTIRVSVKAK
jgi:hypothetical protein